MSRIVGFTFVFADAALSFLSLITSSGTLLLIAVCMLTSLVAGLASALAKTLFWPSYFWDGSQE